MRPSKGSHSRNDCLITIGDKTMSLGIVFKGPEGIVLAADSRVTLTSEIQHGQVKTLLPSSFDNATKLLRITGQNFVGVVTYGLGAIGQQEPRTAHSFVPEFEAGLLKNKKNGEPENGNDRCVENSVERLSVEEFAKKLGDFFMQQWKNNMPDSYDGPDMLFLIGGFDVGEPYGRVFQIAIPSNPVPIEMNPKQFGVSWGGQLEYTNRLIKGFDPNLPSIVQDFLQLTDQQKEALHVHLNGTLSSRIPYQFLPLQDCVDLSIFLIRTTMELQTWTVGVRGVGGAIDVATITRINGFRPVQQKDIVGERRAA